jgi:hypothetical protein
MFTYVHLLFSGESTFMIVQQVEQQISQAWHFIYLQPMQKQPTREDLAGVVFFFKIFSHFIYSDGSLKISHLNIG